MNKTTYIYALYDPRNIEDIRYIGKADNLQKRLSQHISSSLKGGNFKDEWIRSLINENTKPEIKILEEVAYDDPIEWEDREVYYIAYYFNNGHKLENCTPGGSDNFYLGAIKYRHNIWINNKTPITKYKLDEAIMYTRSNCLDIESAWKMRRNFYSTRQESVESDFNLRVASHDVNRSRLHKLGGRKCYKCGWSLNETKWNQHKSLFMDTYIPPEAFTLKNGAELITHDGKVASCDCDKEGMVFLTYNCRLYSRIKSFDKTRVLNSDEEQMRELEYIQQRFDVLMDRQSVIGKCLVKVDIRPLTILFVDDYYGRIIDGKRLLENYGHKVITVNSGISALEKLSKYQFDVVLMGVIMSEMDGIETAKLIRDSEKNNIKHTLIIAMVAPILETNRERFLSDNFDGYIPIPVQVDSLHSELMGIVK